MLATANIFVTFYVMLIAIIIIHRRVASLLQTYIPDEAASNLERATSLF